VDGSRNRKYRARIDARPAGGRAVPQLDHDIRSADSEHGPRDPFGPSLGARPLDNVDPTTKTPALHPSRPILDPISASTEEDAVIQVRTRTKA
jgi:hypothetical protein